MQNLENKNHSIPEAMLALHSDIEEEFNSFRKDLGSDFEKAKVLFSDLKNKIEKHLEMEEKAIFQVCHFSDKEISTTILKLIKKHDEILDDLSRIENEIGSSENVEIEGFGKMLLEHKDFEDKFFYPKLDLALSEGQKEEIIKGIFFF